MSVSPGLATARSAQPWEPLLPSPRGPLTECLFPALKGSPGGLDLIPPVEGDPLSDDDLHLALYVCYEVHYRGFRGVDPRWEWEPALLNLRRELEDAFECALSERFRIKASVDPQGVISLLNRIATEAGPPLSGYLKDRASLAQFREFVIHRSAYQLKEADPQSLVISRLEGKAKAALVEVEFDEYGCGRAERVHAVLFRNTMEAMGLDGRYGAYLDLIPGATLATVNVVSLFGLHRRLRGAAVGHLAISEMTSSQSNRSFAEGLRRLGCGPDATDFFDEHVVADSIHDMIALHDLAGGLAKQDPSLIGDILFGASACSGTDARFARYLLDCWCCDRSSLRSTGSSAS